MTEGIRLKVRETIQDDVGRGRARIDTKTRITLKISPGDIIMIKGKRVTAAIASRIFQDDENKGIIRIDGVIRRNAGVSLEENVVVSKAITTSAEKVVLAPLMQRNQRLKFGPGFENFVKKALLGRPTISGDMMYIPGIAFMGGALPFIATSTVPRGIVKIVDKTEVLIMEEPYKEGDVRFSAVSYEDIGGLQEELKKVREMIELPLKHPEIFDRLAIEPPKGVLLYGPPGSGKTLIAKAIANETGAHFVAIQGPEIMDKYYGASEEHLRKKFEDAQKNAPSILFIDELDSIAPKREDVHGEVERRVVAQMLTLMDGLHSRGKVIVIGATNRVDAIDQALRRPGRFDREIEIGVPDRIGRKEILKIHTRGMPLAKDVNLDFLADITHGYVGADLAALTREAAMKCLRRHVQELDFSKPIPTEVLEKMEVTMADFKNAMKEISPSVLRDVYLEIPKVKWEDIGGMDDIKQVLRECIEWPLRKPEAFSKMGIKPPRGVLLYGPPGCGKTMLAKAVATESSSNFIAVKGPEIFSKWVGESEKAIREIFKKAKRAAPCIIFLDEIDAIASVRDLSSISRVAERVVNQILTSMDSIMENENIIVLAATNRPDMIDPALLRPGRFDRLVYVPPPDKKTRLAMLKVHTKKMPLVKVNLDIIAEITKNYSGADIESLVREAAMCALRENIDATTVEMTHFKKALDTVKPSLSSEIIAYYESIGKKLKSGLQKAHDVRIAYG